MKTTKMVEIVRSIDIAKAKNYSLQQWLIVYCRENECFQPVAEKMYIELLKSALEIPSESVRIKALKRVMFPKITFTCELFKSIEYSLSRYK